MSQWLRLAWIDGRLACDPAAYGGVAQLPFVASPRPLEESQIWVPEAELYQGTLSSYEPP